MGEGGGREWEEGRKKELWSGYKINYLNFKNKKQINHNLINNNKCMAVLITIQNLKH